MAFSFPDFSNSNLAVFKYSQRVSGNTLLCGDRKHPNIFIHISSFQFCSSSRKIINQFTAIDVIKCGELFNLSSNELNNHSFLS